MHRKIFWMSFLLLGFTADLILPLVWSIAATVPIMLLCRRLAYRSEWFE